MKLLLTKCAICFDWYSPKRNHCPCCGAAKIAVSYNSYIHMNLMTGRQVVNGYNHYQFNEQQLAIANVLAGKD